MTDQPKWMPSDEEIMVATVACFRDEGVDPVRALIRAAVEKALAEQEARHRREVIEARVSELDRVVQLMNMDATRVLGIINQAIATGRAELAALEVKP